MTAGSKRGQPGPQIAAGGGWRPGVPAACGPFPANQQLAHLRPSADASPLACRNTCCVRLLLRAARPNQARKSPTTPAWARLLPCGRHRLACKPGGRGRSERPCPSSPPLQQQNRRLQGLTRPPACPSPFHPPQAAPMRLPARFTRSVRAAAAAQPMGSPAALMWRAVTAMLWWGASLFTATTTGATDGQREGTQGALPGAAAAAAAAAPSPAAAGAAGAPRGAWRRAAQAPPPRFDSAAYAEEIRGRRCAAPSVRGFPPKPAPVTQRRRQENYGLQVKAALGAGGWHAWGEG
jgi:hypothetical protein